MTTIETQLLNQGRRAASQDEAGQYAIVINDAGKSYRVWATDAPISLQARGELVTYFCGHVRTARLPVDLSHRSAAQGYLNQRICPACVAEVMECAKT